MKMAIVGRQTATPILRTPEREELAAAIIRHANAEREVTALDEAIEAKREKRRDARRAIEAAELVASTAKANAAQHALDVVLGRAGDPPLSPKLAEVQLSAVRESLSILESEIDGLNSLHDEKSRALVWKANSVTERVGTVVKGDARVADMVARYNAAFRECVSTRRALDYLDAHGLISRDTRVFRSEMPWQDLPGDAAWRAALSALATDADAALPFG